MQTIPFSPPDITEQEIDRVVEVLRSGWITTGPKTKTFEKEIAAYTGTKKAVCLNSATAAMELTLRLLGIGPGDEVITSAYTYTASASVIAHTGAKIVLTDTAPGSYFMDPDKLSSAITARTKAIIPVDIGGVLCDYETLFDIVRQKQPLFRPATPLQKQLGRIAVVGDCAHGFGATRNGKPAGRHADFTCFSFHAVKNLTTVEGGAVVWNSTLNLDDEKIYKEYMLLSLHGQDKDALAKSQAGAWEYDIIYPGYKCNMPDLCAAVGLSQLGRYDAMLARRREIIARYDAAFLPLGVDVLSHQGDHFLSSGHLYLTRLPGADAAGRNEAILEMARRGVTCNVHYKPLPLLSAYQNLGFCIENYPHAFAQYQNQITLPLYNQLTDAQIAHICQSYRAVVMERS